MNRKTVFFLIIALVCIRSISAQNSKRVLFVGNSYTQVNNLPQMVASIAQSMGDEMIYASNTPGGCTFMQHCNNQSMNMICQGNWDVVVLQEQSQYPSFGQEQVEAEVFPYARRLVDSIYAHNPCADPMFYMTWGRKNGDADNATYFPVLATYEGMDSMLYERYRYMSHTYDASLCPVGRVWRYLRHNHSDLELYQSDGSHPSAAGSYAAACAFYVMIYHRDPLLISQDFGLDAGTAQTIRHAVRTVVFENLSDWLRPEPQAAFIIENIYEKTISLINNSIYAEETTWDFGDGETLASSDNSITHTYADTGHYTIILNATRHCMNSTATESIILPQETGIEIFDRLENQLTIYPNPAQNIVTIYANGEVLLYNISGQLIASLGEIHEHTTLSIHDFPSGIYIIRSKGVCRKLIIL